MTAKEAEAKVRERYPDAVCRHRKDEGVHVYQAFSSNRASAGPISHPEYTKARAWKDAAYRTGCKP